MSARYPSSGASRHLLPQGEKEQSHAVRHLPQGEREQLRAAPLHPQGEKELLSSPSPLEGEGGSRRLTDEGSVGSFAKSLRKNMTDAEKRLWSALRDRRFDSFKFRRQFPIGKYVADFICLEHKLVVEVDGSQHEGSASDIVRDQWLNSKGYRVLRLWNRELLLDLDGALLSILAALNATPSPSRGEGRRNKP